MPVPRVTSRLLICFVAATLLLLAQVNDPRDIKTGNTIPDEGYSDQPYVVKTNDGAWLCVIDGKLCDGGDARQFGWGRFSPNLRSVAGDKMLRLGPGIDGEILRLRVYGRALRTSEAIP